MRGNTKIGDVFVVNLENGNKKYFQYIISDLTQLNSDVIRAFCKEYPKDLTPSLLEIITDDVAFYSHCVTKLGVKLSCWQAVGNIKIVGETDNILFRDTNDYGNPDIKISHKWWVWKVNEPQIYVGSLEGRNRKAEIGVVMDPKSIVDKIITGEFGGFYPAFE